MSEYYKHFFHGSCPYTGDKCEKWTCDVCEVEENEKALLKELDKEEMEGAENDTNRSNRTP